MVAPAKWAIVTGANRGLGYDVAKQLAASGRSVIITSRDKAAGAAAAQALSEAAAPGARVVVLQLEASSPDSIRALAAEVQAEYEGQVDLLINNAGVVVADISAADHEATLKTNLDGAIDITLALLPHLAQGARVVQVASQMGMLGMVGPGYRESIKAAATLDDVRAAAHRFDAEDLAQSHPIGPSYAVSKAALISHARSS
ncbi:Short-chain dehydrogenase/reductase 2 [Monoraphidium neglectum]|uniref:Short-chain dehydrogenase/reductase 2 n=1 Tax=Monoraphidium neglectum TaxID=145388 RepID=A0A0D2JPC8_9CHLO|nr:Short-chain dehydrogenase/reductase 2 [Monoraphidium neglectum]KIZ00998.1 Short-chain dehydrogenase/reductase 2 [Monoraphidium neglectum]|eukprot:XP_013900017.1 Short-chain dehydrogenase/reductase 2 [Monoraphidium neglectum]